MSTEKFKTGMGNPFAFRRRSRQPALLENNRIFIPEDDFPTSHVIKVENGNYPDLTRNEHFCMTLAGMCGCPVAETDVLVYPEGNLFVTRRFDRAMPDGGSPIRIHQEDFCQAMGLPRDFKYQAAGAYEGVSSLVDVCRANGIPVGDFFARMLVINHLVGNHDGHAKNVSVQFDPGTGTPHLAPMYDIVSTEIYDFLDRNFGMAFGGTYEKDAMTERSLALAAEDCGMSHEAFATLASDMAETAIRESPGLAAEHAGKYGESGVYGKLLGIVVPSAERMLELCGKAVPKP